MSALALPRLCSAERCGATVSPGRRWCPTHRPCREPGPRTIVHRIARMILSDEEILDSMIEERIGASREQIAQARRLVGIPQPDHLGSLLPWLERALPAARARAAATCRTVEVTAHG